MTVQINCGISTGRARGSGAALQIMHSHPSLDEVITASATSQATTGAAPDLGTNAAVWDIVNGGDAAVWVTFATTPVAAAGTTWLINPGTSKNFSARVGDKCAVINA